MAQTNIFVKIRVFDINWFTQYIVLNNFVKGRGTVHLGEINMAMHQRTLLYMDFG